MITNDSVVSTGSQDSGIPVVKDRYVIHTGESFGEQVGELVL